MCNDDALTHRYMGEELWAQTCFDWERLLQNPLPSHGLEMHDLSRLQSTIEGSSSFLQVPCKSMSLPDTLQAMFGLGTKVHSVGSDTSSSLTRGIRYL